jgi:hypothetical protein
VDAALSFASWAKHSVLSADRVKPLHCPPVPNYLENELLYVIAHLRQFSPIQTHQVPRYRLRCHLSHIKSQVWRGFCVPRLRHPLLGDMDGRVDCKQACGSCFASSHVGKSKINNESLYLKLTSGITLGEPRFLVIRVELKRFLDSSADCTLCRHTSYNS